MPRYIRPPDYLELKLRLNTRDKALYECIDGLETIGYLEVNLTTGEASFSSTYPKGD